MPTPMATVSYESLEHMVRSRVRMFLRHTWLLTILGTLVLGTAVWAAIHFTVAPDYMRIAAGPLDARFVHALSNQLATDHRNLHLQIVPTTSPQATAEAMSKDDDPMYASIYQQLTEAGVEFDAGHDPKSLTLEPGRGLSPRTMKKIQVDTEFVLASTQDALARGDIKHIRYEVDELLKVFQINLDPNCESYRRLARSIQSAFVKQLKAVLARQRGEGRSSMAIVDRPDYVSGPLAARFGCSATPRPAVCRWIPCVRRLRAKLPRLDVCEPDYGKARNEIGVSEPKPAAALTSVARLESIRFT